MADMVTIAGSSRSTYGKGYCRKIRTKGLIPANIVHNGNSTPIELDAKLLSKAWKDGRRFNLEMGGSSKVVQITELQINPVKRSPLHVDLAYVE